MVSPILPTTTISYDLLDLHHSTFVWSFSLTLVVTPLTQLQPLPCKPTLTIPHCHSPKHCQTHHIPPMPLPTHSSFNLPSFNHNPILPRTSSSFAPWLKLPHFFQQHIPSLPPRTHPNLHQQSIFPCMHHCFS